MVACVRASVSECLSPATSRQLDHLILIGCDDPGQTAGQQHANQLKDRQERALVYFVFFGLLSILSCCRKKDNAAHIYFSTNRFFRRTIQCNADNAVCTSCLY